MKFLIGLIFLSTTILAAPGSSRVTPTQYLKNGTSLLLVPSSGNDTLVARTTVDTLTNKDLSGNTATSLISGSGTFILNTTGTVTVPNATDTLVGKATTDVFTNKSYDAAGTGNVLANVANANIATAAAIARTKIANGTNNHVIINDGSGVLSSEAALAISRGGSNNGGLAVTAGGVLYTDGTSFQNVGAGSSGQFLKSNAGSAPTWAAAGSSTLNTTSQTTTYAALTTDDIIFASGSAFTVTLPTAVGQAGHSYQIIKTDASLTNIITIATTSAQTFQLGSSQPTTIKLHTPGESWLVVSDNANWQIRNHVTKTQPVAYTPTFSGLGTVTNVGVYSWRDGVNLCTYAAFQDGTVSGVESFTIGFNGTNNNVTFDATNIGTTTERACAAYFSNNTASANGDVVASPSTSTNNLYFWPHGGTAITSSNLGTNSVIRTGVCCLPIDKWYP